MKPISILTFIILSILHTSCSFAQDFEVTVRVANLSAVEYDSIRIYCYPDKSEMLYKFKPGDSLIKIFEYRNFKYKKGEQLSSSLIVFKDDYYYMTEAGLIDIPYAFLEDNYNYFIYDGYATTQKGLKLINKPEKYKISEMPKESLERLNRKKD